MEISIKWNICRVCLKEERKTSRKANCGSNIELVNLFTVKKKLAFNIFELFGVSMKPDDSLPDKICTKCVTTVNSAIQLRETCRSSNTYLQCIVERTKSASTLPKPEISICQIAADDDYNADSSLEDQSEHNGDEQRDVKVRDKKSDDDPEEDQEKQLKPDLSDNASDYTVEMEEIIEMSGDEGIFYTEIITDDEGDRVTTFDTMVQNNKGNQSSNESNKNAEEKRNIALPSKIHQTDSDDGDCDLIENEDTVSEKSMEYADEDQEEKQDKSIELSVMDDWQDQVQNDNEDQAQVSSTVNTKEMEYYEDNSNTSNLSNDLDKQSHSHDQKILKKRSTIVLGKKPKLRMNRNLFKATANDPVQVYACKLCGNRFANHTRLKFHMKVHLQHKDHQCEICFKSFITACNLQAHMRIHTGEKPYECKYCGRRFNDRSSHIRHERTHTKEKPFECSDCGRTFTLSTTLQNHMKTHSNERSYRCEPCGKSFKLRHHLKTHQNTTLHRSAVQTADDDE